MSVLFGVVLIQKTNCLEDINVAMGMGRQKMDVAFTTCVIVAKNLATTKYKR
jgi:hypothetical protein